MTQRWMGKHHFFIKTALLSLFFTKGWWCSVCVCFLDGQRRDCLQVLQTFLLKGSSTDLHPGLERLVLRRQARNFPTSHWPFMGLRGFQMVRGERMPNVLPVHNQQQTGLVSKCHCSEHLSLLRKTLQCCRVQFCFPHHLLG